MKWSSTVVADNTLAPAVAQAAATLLQQLGQQAPDLLIVFISPHHQEQYGELPKLLPPPLNSALLIGCSAGGVIGGGAEVERRPGLSMTAAVLPEVQLQPFYLTSDELPATSAAWESLLGVSAARQPHFLLLPDPFSFAVDDCIQALDRTFPTSRKIGGMASGGDQAGAHALYLEHSVYRSGLVGLALSGNVAVDTIVAQGCRPIGEPMFVTGAQRNVLHGLDGQPPLQLLNALYGRLDEADRELFKHSLFLGIAMRGAEQEYRHGDFLIRNLIGMDPDSGALAVGALLQENSVVQFHLRDAQTSAADLELLLTQFERAPTVQPQGALLFSCLGRGLHLYGRPDHDTELFRKHLGPVPLGGFFCNGEIGPVQQQTFVHGYTSSFGLFGPRAHSGS